VKTQKPKPTAPYSQTMPSTVPDRREAKTARPAKGRNLDTPRVAETPPPLVRKH
jgi:hypothetical protein